MQHLKPLKAPKLKPGNICLKCGLCCDGSLFADVKLQLDDNVGHLLSLGMPVALRPSKTNARTAPTPKGWQLPQPCAAFDGCKCRIYSSRPDYCRRFECLLLKKLQNGTVTRASAERLIRRARSKTALVEELLQALGQTEAAGLADRFRSLTKRLERQTLDKKTSGLYSKLTLVFHELNLLLHEHFYLPSN